MDPHAPNSTPGPTPDSAADLALWRQVMSVVDQGVREACPDVHVLAGYLDGMLPADAQETVSGHLAACTACRTAVIEARVMLTSPEPAPSAVIERAQALAEPPAVVGRIGMGVWRQAVGWGLAAAASIAVGFVGYDLGVSTQTNDQDALVEMTFGLVTPLENEAFDVELFALASREVGR